MNLVKVLVVSGVGCVMISFGSVASAAPPMVPNPHEPIPCDMDFSCVENAGLGTAEEWVDNNVITWLYPEIQNFVTGLAGIAALKFIIFRN